MAESKNQNWMQENWPIWLLVVVALLVIAALINRNAANQQEETATVNEEEESNQSVETPAQETAQNPEPSPSAIAESQTAGTGSNVSPVTPVPSSITPSAGKLSSTAQQKKMFAIQIQSFQDQTKAHKSLMELTKAGYTPYIVRRDLKEKGIWYRVFIGDFQSKQEANTKLAELKQKYKDSFVVSR